MAVPTDVRIAPQTRCRHANYARKSRDDAAAMGTGTALVTIDSVAAETIRAFARGSGEPRAAPEAEAIIRRAQASPARFLSSRDRPCKHDYGWSEVVLI